MATNWRSRLRLWVQTLKIFEWQHPFFFRCKMLRAYQNPKKTWNGTVIIKNGRVMHAQTTALGTSKNDTTGPHGGDLHMTEATLQSRNAVRHVFKAENR